MRIYFRRILAKDPDLHSVMKLLEGKDICLENTVCLFLGNAFEFFAKTEILRRYRRKPFIIKVKNEILKRL